MIKAAVIGLGNMGQHHAKAYSAIAEASLVAVCDHNKDRFDRIIKEKDTQYFSSVDDLLASQEIDVVSICLPTTAHFEIAKKCIDYNIAVLVEKPITQTIQQAKELVAYAKEHNVMLTVGHIERFNPAITRVKEWMTEGNLGDVQTILCKRYGPFPKQIKDADVLVDVAVHDIDIVQFLVDSQLVSSDVYTHHIHCDDRADYGHLMLQFEPKLMVNIHVSWALPFKQREVEIVGDKGIAIIDCISQSMTYYDVDVEKGADYVSLPLSDPQTVAINKKEPIIEECRSFVDSVMHQTSPIVLPEQALASLKIALQQPSPALV